MNEFKQVATIDFRVTGGTLQDAYDMMKKYQLYDQAGEDANIIYEGVSIPAGYCESFEEVESLYQALKLDCKKVGRQRQASSTMVEVDFYTEGNNLEEVFECMQQYKNHGYADRHSNIICHDVVIPAGYCDTYSDLEAMYYSMLSGDSVGFLQSVSSGIPSHELIDQYEMERAKIIENGLNITSYQWMLVYKK